jgi:hypothetical protein
MTPLLRVIAGGTLFLALCPNLAAATSMESSRDLIGVCTSARAEDVAYCEGYIEGAAHIWKFQGVPDLSELRDPPQDPRRRGFGEGSFQASAIMFVIADSLAFRPCFERESSAQEMKEALLQFVRDNPEQQRGAYAVLLLQKALFYGVCPGPSARLKPHMEQCAEWDYDGDEYVAKNTCNRPVVVRFQAAMIASEQTKERQVNAWQTFRTGLTRFEMEGSDWIYTVCRSAMSATYRSHRRMQRRFEQAAIAV